MSVSWPVFFASAGLVFVALNGIFALVFFLGHEPIANVRTGSFMDLFFFSIETLATVGYGDMHPQTHFGHAVATVEIFTGMSLLAVMTGLIFARFSRPFARVIFSKVAVIAPFDGVPTLMFRTANQRGNQVLDASMTLTLARQHVSREGIVMRRFEELKLVRPRTSLFSLSWTIMHVIDESSPLFGIPYEEMIDKQMEIVALLSGSDATMAETIYARYAYGPDDIIRDHRFVDVLSLTPRGQRLVDLTRFHDTCPI